MITPLTVKDTTGHISKITHVKVTTTHTMGKLPIETIVKDEKWKPPKMDQ